MDSTHKSDDAIKMFQSTFRFKIISVLMVTIGFPNIRTIGLRVVFNSNSIFTRHFCSSSICDNIRSALIADMNVRQLYSVASSILKEYNVSEPEDSARFLLSHVANLGYRRSEFYSNSNQKLNPQQLEQFRSSISKRIDRTPVQYIIGNWEFYGLTLECREPILIPRPETEELVERIISSEISQGIKNPRILDVGAGTGAIGIALVENLPSSTCLAIDINPNAVSLANINACRIFGSDYSARYNCILSSFSDYCLNGQTESDLFDIIVSNPPYIPSVLLATLEPEVRLFEDPVALDGGADGLDIILDLIRQSAPLLKKDGPRELWMEVSEHHPETIRHLLESKALAVSCQFIECANDLAGNPRFIRIKYPQ